MKANGMAVVMLGVAMAAPVAAETRVAVGGGPSLGRVAIEDLDSGLENEWRAGWNAGVSIEHAWSPAFSIAIGASWTDSGGRVSVAGADDRLELDLQELTVPLLARLGRPVGRVRPYALAGPALVWRRRAEVAVTSAGQELVREDITSDLDRTGLAAVLGAGLELGQGRVRPFVEAQYVHGLTGLDATDPSAEDFTRAKTRAFQLRVGLTFGGAR